MSAHTIFKRSQKGQKAYSLPKSDEVFSRFAPSDSLSRKQALPLPEVSELDLTRHFTTLARNNMGIDSHFYPLGSCTMKLNPRVNEWAAAHPRFQQTHPLAPDETVQGNLEVLCELGEELCKVTGMTAASIVPNAGAQGEFCGVQMIAAYHSSRGDSERTEMLIPDAAHGTNPATAQIAGFKTVSLKTGPDGDIDLEELRSKVSSKTAGLMLTNPNTLGLFSEKIVEIAATVHDAGGLLYYDGANLNAILNVARPGEMGFDVMHINLHKTFSTPHGGGGPGSGPVCCNEKLAPFLPTPRVERSGDRFVTRWNDKTSIGKLASFYGNFGIALRAYLYLKLHGHYGLRRIAEIAVLNANYLKKKLSATYTVPYSQTCMHEFVIRADSFMDQGVRAMDIAKRLLDFGIHSPTVYFPLIVKECLLVEPTESESLETLDRFVSVMETIAKEAQENPDLVKNAPHTQSRTRLNEVMAAKQPILKHEA